MKKFILGVALLALSFIFTYMTTDGGAHSGRVVFMILATFVPGIILTVKEGLSYLSSIMFR